MKTRIGGVLFGLIVGWLAVATVFASVPVTWDGSRCPTGSFPVVLTLTAVDDPSDARSVSQMFTLPGPVNFSINNLPARDYIARAVTDGRFQSESQTVRGDGPVPSPSPSPSPVQQLASVTLTPSTVNEGGTAQAVAKDGAGNVLSGVTWSLEHPVGSIDASGKITGVTLAAFPGRTIPLDVWVTGTLNGAKAAAKLTVSPGVAPTTPTPTPTPSQTVDLSPVVTRLDQIVLTQQQMIGLLQQPAPPVTVDCVWTTVNGTSVYARCKRVDFPTVVVGGSVKVIK